MAGVDWRYNATNILTVTITDSTSGTVEGATVLLSLVDEDGTGLPSSTWPTTVSHSTSGQYPYTSSTGDIDDISLDSPYFAEITATQSGTQAYAKILLNIVQDED